MADSTSLVIYDPRTADPDVMAGAAFLAGHTGRTREATASTCASSLRGVNFASCAWSKSTAATSSCTHGSGAGGPVVGLPVRVGLAGPGPGQLCLVVAHADHAAVGRGGARAASGQSAQAPLKRAMPLAGFDIFDFRRGRWPNPAVVRRSGGLNDSTARRWFPGAPLVPNPCGGFQRWTRGLPTRP